MYTWNLDWFTVLHVSFVIGRGIILVLALRHSIDINHTNIERKLIHYSVAY